jgi:predicted esterase
MNLTQAGILANAAKAAYHKDPLKSGLVNARSIDRFNGECFSGFVASDEEKVILSFRGTETSIDSFDLLVSSVRQWLRNFNFAQTSTRGYKVHKGFENELNGVYRFIPQMVCDHGAGWKRLFVTGHSAGGALATLAARRLSEDGLPVEGAYVFASPRVGDRSYADSYDVPLYRFEYQDDIVPHVPFSPSVMAILDSIVEDFYPVIETFFPSLMNYTPGSVEYVHAGQLFFVDWDNDLYSSADFWDFLDTLFEDESPSPWQPMPKPLMDVGRFLNTMGNIKEFLSQGSFEFIKHHHLSGVVDLIGRLIKGR